MLTISHTNILGNILNTTFGKSGMRGGPRARANDVYSVKGKLEGDNMVLALSMMINVTSEGDRQHQFNKATDEAIQVLASQIKAIKKRFKDDSGETLETKEIKEQRPESFVLVSATGNSSRKTYLFRRNVRLEIRN